MSRRIPITSITQSSSNPGTFTIGVTSENSTGDWTGVFLGKFFRSSLATGPTPDSGDIAWWNGHFPSPPSDTPPSGKVLIVATQFDVIENSRYSGRYTGS